MMLNYIRNKRGQSIVELAIILPVLLLILMGIFEFGRIMNVYLIINHASREGVRTASVGGDDMAIMERVQEASSTLNPMKRTVTVDPVLSSRKRGATVTVKVEYDIDIITPVIEAVVPDPLHLESKTIMRVE